MGEDCKHITVALEILQGAIVKVEASMDKFALATADAAVKLGVIVNQLHEARKPRVTVVETQTIAMGDSLVARFTVLDF